MNKDISDLLHEWEYDPEDNIRIIHADDNREIMQVRQPMGIEQYELEGRPDGIRPFGHETFFEVLQKKLGDHILEKGDDRDFAVSRDDFLLLQSEAVLYYYRYLNLFQINDYDRTIRDTEHNLMVADFVEKYVSTREDAVTVLQYKPYIIRMHAIAQAMILLDKNKKEGARSLLDAAILRIQNIKDIDTPAFKFEKIRSLQYLRSVLRQVDEKTEDPVEELNQKLQDAVEEENYELAAELRDRIEELARSHSDGGV